MRIREHIPYAPATSHQLTLDLATPDRPSDLLLLLVHGGGWDKGDKDAFRPELEHFARLGFPAASLNYRRSREASYPACLDDVAAAARFLAKDFPRLVLAGHSAGGHLAALAACLLPTAGLIGLSGVYDLRRQTLRRHKIGFVNCLERLLGGPYTDPAIRRLARSASPICRLPELAAHAPRILLIAGQRDAGVPTAQTREFAAALHAAGLRVESHLLPRAGHYVHYDQRPRVLSLMARFLSRLHAPARLL